MNGQKAVIDLPMVRAFILSLNHVYQAEYDLLVRVGRDDGLAS